MGIWKASTAIKEEQREWNSARESYLKELEDKAGAERAELRRSELPGHYWDGCRLVNEETKRVVSKLCANDHKWSSGVFGDLRSIECEWKTTDGALFVDLAAAKRHQEKLVIR